MKLDLKKSLKEIDWPFVISIWLIAAFVVYVALTIFQIEMQMNYTAIERTDTPVGE
jgi:hypothetical protein